jgi:hypothetical protein
MSNPDQSQPHHDNPDGAAKKIKSAMYFFLNFVFNVYILKRFENTKNINLNKYLKKNTFKT